MNRAKTLKRDKKGYYYRNLGWLSRGNGEKWTQPKFLLGRNEREALDRLRRLERLWELVKQHHESEYADGKPTWDKLTLAVGRAICRGEHVFPLPRQNQPGDGPEDAAWANADYAGYLRQIQEGYPIIAFIPEDADAFENGLGKNLEMAQNYRSSADEKQTLAEDFARDAGQPTPVREVKETLHKAIRAFVDSIDSNPTYRNHNKGPGEQPLKASGYKLKHDCLDFCKRYKDRPLSSLGTLSSLQSLYDYWRDRPGHRRTGDPIKVRTAGNRMKMLTLLLKWLHRTDDFSWRKPGDFEEIERSVNETKEEKAARARPDQAETFSDEELAILYQSCTTPLERLLMLLGLNCGFKLAEAGTLTPMEIVLDARHPYADLLEYRTSESDSFVKRIRQKTDVYGELKLWPHTVHGLQWLVERRQQQTKIASGAFAGEDITMSQSSVLLTNRSGYPMYRLYKSGNTSQDIPKCWRRTVERAAEGSSAVHVHSYSALRRTTANFLRLNYDGEVASLFLFHGHPFEKDKLLEEYTNRPYGRLFKALDHFAERLRRMFDAVPDPFPSEEKKGGTNIGPGKIREIKRLLAEGKSKSDAARIAGVHRTTVYRYAE